MTVTASLIQRLHRINRQKADLHSQLERGPKAVAAAGVKLKSAEDQLQAVRDGLKRSKVEADSKQLQMKERENKIVELNGKLNAAKENREYQALKDQIAADTQANVVLSDEILEILESIDQQELDVKASQENLAQVAKEVEEVTQRIADKRVKLESDLERVEGELAETEKELSGDFLREYKRMVGAKGEDGMAELEGKSCGGCYQSLTPQLLDRTKIGQPIICPACGRLLYLPS
jgi:hypothetical protein